MSRNQIVEFFVQLEEKWLEKWYNEGTVDKYLRKNDSSDRYFSFLDGPITANNPMGVHHAWGRTYKDVWQRFHNLKGYKQRFQNGFDCQGLWVEVEVEKELGLKTKKDIENLVPGDKKASIAKFVQLCKDRVMKFAGIQTEQTKRLGNFMDWENSYFTMSEDNNYMIWHFLKVCHENGWIYKGHESVPWCPRCETAISQHEMLTEDYKEVTHESIYLKLPLEGRENEHLLIWTTTPWTIPANIVVAVDKDMEYALVKGNTGDLFWVAKEAVKRIFASEEAIKQTIKGKELVGLKYKGPFDDLPVVQSVKQDNPETFHTVIATDERIMPISADEGTGLVHTAVSAGTEDFRLGKKYGLPMIPVIADNADYLEGLGFLTGKNAKKDPRIILDHLQKKDSEGENWVFKIEKYTHRYPGCWRCKEELVWKVADEWYIAMDLPSKVNESDNRTLRERMIDVAKQITWMPEFGLDRELDWLKNMHDWLISKKNRYWGLALPIYECTACGTFEVIGSKSELEERAVAGWEEFEGHSPHKPFIDEVKIQCRSCGETVSRILDVGNPWLDAGIVPYSTIKDNNRGEPLYLKNRKQWENWFPANFITESFPGQFKNWFYAMIAMSTVLEDRPPYERVLGFATLLAEDGRPMHKSWGNSIAFEEGAKDIGVDVMRWMYMRHNPADNLLFGHGKADEARKTFYLTFWNIFKFYRTYAEAENITYLGDDLRIDEVRNVLDQWVLMRLQQTLETVDASLSKYKPKKAAVAIESFIQDVSMWYLRRSRDRASGNSQDSRDFFHTMQFVLVQLSIISSPLLPFITEEIYTYITKKESVHLEQWPQLDFQVDENLLSDMELTRRIVEDGHRIRKEEKIRVRQPLAELVVSLPDAESYILDKNREQYLELIQDELNVKNVTVKSSATEFALAYDTKITDELQLEGELRDLVRKIQNKRKRLGVSVEETVHVTVPGKFKQFEEEIKSSVNAQSVDYDSELRVAIP